MRWFAKAGVFTEVVSMDEFHIRLAIQFLPYLGRQAIGERLRISAIKFVEAWLQSLGPAAEMAPGA